MGIFSGNQKKYNLQEIEFEITNLTTKIASTKVNHILHLLFSLLTAGLWIIVWILIILSTNSEIKGYEKSLQNFNKIKYDLLNLKEENKIIQDKKDTSEELKDTKNMNNTEKLIKLSEMLEKNLLTKEEFQQQKEKLL